MIEITDSAGRTLVLDDAELTVAEIRQRYDDWMQLHHPDPATFTIIIGKSQPEPIEPPQPAVLIDWLKRVPTTIELHDLACNPNAPQPIHRPPPTSARWEGPPPKRRRGRR